MSWKSAVVHVPCLAQENRGNVCKFSIAVFGDISAVGDLKLLAMCHMISPEGYPCAKNPAAVLETLF